MFLKNLLMKKLKFITKWRKCPRVCLRINWNNSKKDSIETIGTIEMVSITKRTEKMDIENMMAEMTEEKITEIETMISKILRQPRKRLLPNSELISRMDLQSLVTKRRGKLKKSKTLKKLQRRSIIHRKILEKS